MLCSFCMKKQLQLAKYSEAVLFVTLERVFMAESSSSNTQMGVVGGMCYYKELGNTVISNNRLTERCRWERPLEISGPSQISALPSVVQEGVLSRCFPLPLTGISLVLCLRS